MRKCRRDLYMAMDLVELLENVLGNIANRMTLGAKYKAVVFDAGGVVVQYRDTTLLKNVLTTAKSNPQFGKAFVDWESGRTTMVDLVNAIHEYIPGQRTYDIDEFMENFSGSTDVHIEKAIRTFKASGLSLKTALLTNTGYIYSQQDPKAYHPNGKRKTLVPDLPSGLFDLIIESCKFGTRKPDAKLFVLTAELLGVKPEECIFMDDLKENCEAAESTGMTAIHVGMNQTDVAVQELAKILQMKLD
ncbi:acyl-CoA dehydrogenase family member 10 [Aphelenchoides avenae]|nr:acyl-CoA dehydrogenase family member 10 [Aphelenchus avenae]